MKLYPRCHSHWLIDGKEVRNSEYTKGKSIAYTSEGWLLPCCWCDQENEANRTDFEILGFWDSDLKLSENETVDNILVSPIWMDFNKILLEKPELSPTICQKKCSKGPKGGLPTTRDQKFGIFLLKAFYFERNHRLSGFL